jgi:hypothetical protein
MLRSSLVRSAALNARNGFLKSPQHVLAVHRIPQVRILIALEYLGLILMLHGCRDCIRIRNRSHQFSQGLNRRPKQLRFRFHHHCPGLQLQARPRRHRKVSQNHHRVPKKSKPPSLRPRLSRLVVYLLLLHRPLPRRRRAASLDTSSISLFLEFSVTVLAYITLSHRIIGTISSQSISPLAKM